MQKNRYFFFFPFLILLLCSGILPVWAEKKEVGDRFSLAFEVGNWQPHSLNDEPRFDTFGKAGATAFGGVNLTIPLRGGLGLRLSLGYWALRDLEEIESVHSLTLHPLTLDFKRWLVPDPHISAYVMYGGGIYWGVENETQPFGESLSRAETGWGINLGAGVDIVLRDRLGLGISFQYLYVHFSQPLGGVDDFSGPKMTGMLFYYL